MAMEDHLTAEERAEYDEMPVTIQGEARLHYETLLDQKPGISKHDAADIAIRFAIVNEPFLDEDDGRIYVRFHA